MAHSRHLVSAKDMHLPLLDFPSLPAGGRAGAFTMTVGPLTLGRSLWKRGAPRPMALLRVD